MHTVIPIPPVVNLLFLFSLHARSTTSMFKHFSSILLSSVGPSDVLDVERMSESDLSNGEQVFTFIISMVTI